MEYELIDCRPSGQMFVQAVGFFVIKISNISIYNMKIFDCELIDEWT